MATQSAVPSPRAEYVHARLRHLIERREKLLENYGESAGAKNTQLRMIEYRIRKLEHRLRQD